MFRTQAEQVSLWEAVLPAEVVRLPEELARVDALLDDPVFFAPFVPFFDPRMGRPSTPMETYLRLMFLKFRYRLGYESLCREVADSISWRRFCRIRLDGQVPHPTTLMKLTTRCGPAAVDACNEGRSERRRTSGRSRIESACMTVRRMEPYPSGWTVLNDCHLACAMRPSSPALPSASSISSSAGSSPVITSRKKL
jgi:IS5 family transposase